MILSFCIQPNSCIENGFCYEVNQTNPDGCSVCSVLDGIKQWTTIPGNKSYKLCMTTITKSYQLCMTTITKSYQLCMTTITKSYQLYMTTVTKSYQLYMTICVERTVYGDMHLKDLVGSMASIAIGYRIPVLYFYLVIYG